MNKKILIFDFDGTIADTLHHLIQISNRLSKEFHFKTIEPEDVDFLKDRTSVEIIKHLKIPLLKIPALATRIKKELSSDMADVPIVNGLKESLSQLKSEKHTLGILSSNAPENVSTFLKKHNIDFFDFVHTTSKIWSKDIYLNQLLKDKKFPKEDVLYIGDEIRDILAAKKAGIKCAAVSWGYNSVKALEQTKPDFMLKDPAELIHSFGNLKKNINNQIF